jgi:colanic acid/amylovoran biosynthesis glycosyltransferase
VARPTVGHVMRAYLANSETFVRNQITALRRYRPVVAAHHRRPGTQFPLDEGVIAQDRLSPPVARLQVLAYRAARTALPPATSTLARYLREQDARLLHYHFLTDARFLLGVKARAGLPAIASAYGYDVASFPRAWGGLGRLYLRPLFARLDGFLVMSEDMRQDLLDLGCPDAKITVHYHGSDTKRFRHPERVYGKDGPLVVLCVARLSHGKGQHLLLQALRRVERRGRDDFRVVIVGEGPMRSELERLAAEYSWRERVTFAGHVPYTSDALVAHYRRADIFALASITRTDGGKEGIPGTIVEAMASGLPVIGSDLGGIPAVIEPGQHGLLVPEQNVDALASALEALLVDAALRQRLGTAAADRAARELDLDDRTVELERIYDRFM